MHTQRGFTLTELAVVLVVIALLLGGLIVPLSTQRDIENQKATTRQLTGIRDALIGFVITYGRLPCPDTDTDPSAAVYGLEEITCTADQASEGFLPWKTLGTAEHDAWGSPWSSAAEPRQGHWRYRIERDYADAALLRSLILNGNDNNGEPCHGGSAIPPAFPDDCLAVVNNGGQRLYANKERPVAIVYSLGHDQQANGQNASFEGRRTTDPTYQADIPSANFDDQLIWLTRNNLINLLISVGKLP